jgi:hypothetical protein
MQTTHRVHREDPPLPGALSLNAPDGSVLIIQALPGRGWRCCPIDRPLHQSVPLYASLRWALIDWVSGTGDDDPWLLATLRRLAPEELVG